MAEIREINSSYYLARKLFENGKYEEAFNLAMGYVATNSHDPEGWILVSDCLLKLAQNTSYKNLETRMNYLKSSIEAMRMAMEAELNISIQARFLRDAEIL